MIIIHAILTVALWICLTALGILAGSWIASINDELDKLRDRLDALEDKE